MLPPRCFRTLLPLAVALLLATLEACGGGSDGGDAVSSSGDASPGDGGAIIVVASDSATSRAGDAAPATPVDAGTADPADGATATTVDAAPDEGLDAEPEAAADVSTPDAPVADASVVDASVVDAPVVEAGPVCASTQLLCGAACVAIDTNNCGTCGHACSDGETCQAGLCACPTGETLCGSACTPTATDDANCGTCGNACTGGETCESGTCACPSDQTFCGAACTNESADANNCGACGTRCVAAETCQSGVCACPSGETLCGSTCVAESSDANNCGACGHGCLGGACSGGQCQSFPLTTTLSGEGGALSLGPDDVYIVTATGLYSCAKTGCTSATLIAASDSYVNVLYEPKLGQLYVADYSNGGTVYEETVLGGLDSVQTFVGPLAFATDANDVYLGFQGGVAAGVKSVESFSTARMIATVPGQIESVAVDPAEPLLYAIVGGQPGSLIRAATNSTGAYTTYLANQPDPAAIAVAGGQVLWTNDSAVADGGVSVCPTGATCSSPTQLVTGSYCRAITTDTTDAYFSCTDAVYRCPLAGCATGQLTTLVSGNMPYGASLANDATALYWIASSGALMKLAK